MHASKIRCDEKSWKNLGTKQATATGEGSPIWDGLLGSSSTSYAGVTGTLAHWLRGSLLGWAHKVSDERRAHTAGGAARSDGHHCGIQRVRYAAACGRWGHARVMPVRCHVSYGGSGLPAGCRWSDSLTPECEGRGHRIKKKFTTPSSRVRHSWTTRNHARRCRALAVSGQPAILLCESIRGLYVVFAR
jgi:hypothetical protein